MRRFFIALFILSLIASAGAYYWREYQPEKVVSAPISKRSLAPEEGAPSVATRSERVLEKAPSERQDLAMTISILSSIISAAAALLQTWLTARALRR